MAHNFLTGLMLLLAPWQPSRHLPLQVQRNSCNALLSPLHLEEDERADRDLIEILQARPVGFPRPTWNLVVQVTRDFFRHLREIERRSSSTFWPASQKEVVDRLVQNLRQAKYLLSKSELLDPHAFASARTSPAQQMIRLNRISTNINNLVQEIDAMSENLTRSSSKPVLHSDIAYALDLQELAWKYTRYPRGTPDDPKVTLIPGSRQWEAYFREGLQSIKLDQSTYRHSWDDRQEEPNFFVPYLTEFHLSRWEFIATSFLPIYFMNVRYREKSLDQKIIGDSGKPVSQAFFYIHDRMHASTSALSWQDLLGRNPSPRTVRKEIRRRFAELKRLGEFIQTLPRPDQRILIEAFFDQSHELEYRTLPKTARSLFEPQRNGSARHWFYDGDIVGWAQYILKLSHSRGSFLSSLQGEEEF